MDTSQGRWTQLVKPVVLLVEEHVELVGCVESEVEVEDDETETASVTIAIGFHIILRIVGTTQIHLCCHVVDELVDIQYSTDFIIGQGVSSIG